MKIKSANPATNLSARPKVFVIAKFGTLHKEDNVTLEVASHILKRSWFVFSC
jgi:hypothetical protein